MEWRFKTEWWNFLSNCDPRPQRRLSPWQSNNTHTTNNTQTKTLQLRTIFTGLSTWPCSVRHSIPFLYGGFFASPEASAVFFNSIIIIIFLHGFHFACIQPSKESAETDLFIYNCPSHPGLQDCALFFSLAVLNLCGNNRSNGLVKKRLYPFLGQSRALHIFHRANFCRHKFCCFSGNERLAFAL